MFNIMPISEADSASMTSIKVKTDNERAPVYVLDDEKIETGALLRNYTVSSTSGPLGTAQASQFTFHTHTGKKPHIYVECDISSCWSIPCM